MSDTRTDEKKAEDVIKVRNILARKRQPYESMIDDVITYVNHSRRKINDSEGTKGAKTGMEVYDGTAIGAANLMRDGLCGHTVSQHLRWFRYELPGKFNFPKPSGMRSWSGKRMDEYPEIQQYLEDAEDVAFAAYRRSNFYDMYPEFVHDGLTIGTVTIDSEEDIGSGRIVFTVPHFRECFFAENRFGMVDTNYREYNLSLRQLVDRFGMEKMKKVDVNFATLYENNSHDERTVIRARYPRKDYDWGRLDAKNKPFASLWVDKKTKVLIEETGTDELSSITWRYRKNNDEICGRSPAWDAYVEIMKANQQGRTNLKAGHRAVEPPIIAPADLRGKINKLPDAITWVEGFTEKLMPRPLYTNVQIPYSVEQQNLTDKIIREYFHVDFFLMLYRAAFEGVELTATQVLGMQGEQAAILGVRIGRLDSEALDPISDRVFAIESKSGRIPEPPDILLDYIDVLARRGESVKIEIDYLGPLAQAQKRIFKMYGINAGLDFLAKIQTIAPESIDEINISQTVKEGLYAVSWPASCLNTEEQVRRIREIRQQEREMAKTIQAGGEIAKMVQKTSKEVQPGSPMEAIIGGGEGA